MTEIAIFLLGAAIGLFSAPTPAIIPPTPSASTRCAELPKPSGRTLDEVYKSAVDAGDAYRDACLNHDELVDWSERTLDR